MTRSYDRSAKRHDTNMVNNGHIPIYEVVINHEEQYSIWRADTNPPKGWKKVGRTGSKEECLTFIKEVWTDMRPRSQREQMD
jgi:MbtH protein